MKTFITLLFIISSLVVSAQEKSTDSTQTKPNTTVVLRCQGSTLQPEPLFVIDGVLQNSDKFRKINPNDIVNISVLKDATGTEFFSNKSNNNGVIIVKTKNGLTKKEKRKMKRESKKLEKEQKTITN